MEKNFVKICESFAHEDHLYRSARQRNRIAFHKLSLPINSIITEDDVASVSCFAPALRDLEKMIKPNPSMDRIPFDYAFDRLRVNFGLDENVIEQLAQIKNLAFDSDGFVQYKDAQKLKAKAK